VTRLLKARIVEKEEAATATQWRSKQFFTATNKHGTIEKLMRVVFSVQSTPRLYNEDQQEKLAS
jgi:hypothetical protein